MNAIFLSSTRVSKSLRRTLSTNSITQLYKDEVNRGKLREDGKQLVLLSHLDALKDDLDNFNYTPPKSNCFFSKLFSISKTRVEDHVKGLYVYGNVGCGKTMLMDLFYDNINSVSKQRTHFYDFMLDVHERIHEYKLTLPPKHISDRKNYDPIPVVAGHIASETKLLCFDEFQVTDVADAMILKRLFEKLFAAGVVMIATGNRKPDDLYKNGLQRSNFLPFIPLLKSNCSVLDMDSVVDYRMSTPKPLDIPGGRSYAIKDNAILDDIFEYLTETDIADAVPRALKFLGRQLTVGRSTGKVLMTNFKEICEGTLGSSDYRAIAKEYSHVLIKDFPQLSLRNKTYLRRFIVMMDTFYDRSVKLVISCDVPMVDIISLDEGNHEEDLRVLMDDLELMQAEAKTMNLFTGEDELFSQKRALSRLHEMQCLDYWNLPHQKRSKK